MTSGTKKAGRVQLWYSPRNGGTNCVIVDDKRSGKHTIGASTDRRNVGGWNTKDVGDHPYYAGPRSLRNMNGTCVSWGRNMDIGSRDYSAFQFNRHCG